MRLYWNEIYSFYSRKDAGRKQYGEESKGSNHAPYGYTRLSRRAYKQNPHYNRIGCWRDITNTLAVAIYVSFF